MPQFMRLSERIAVHESGQLELIKGKIERMAPAQSERSYYHSVLFRLLASAYDFDSFWIGIDLAVRTGEQTVRGADLAVVRGAEPRPGLVPVEDVALLVEVSHTTITRDLLDKAGEYASIGAGHYWVVDLTAKVTHVLGKTDGRDYLTRDLVRFGEELTTPETDRVIVIPEYKFLS